MSNRDDLSDGMETAITLSRRSITTLIVNWATGQGIVDPEEPFAVGWYYNGAGEVVGIRIDVLEDEDLVNTQEEGGGLPSPPKGGDE